MGWPSIADAANRVVRDTFGEAVTYLPAAGGSVAIVAPFSEEYEQVASDGQATVVSQRPNLLVRLADLPAPPAEGDRFTVRGRTYAVEQEPHLDGTGTGLVFGKRVAT